SFYHYSPLLVCQFIVSLNINCMKYANTSYSNILMRRCLPVTSEGDKLSGGLRGSRIFTWLSKASKSPIPTLGSDKQLQANAIPTKWHITRGIWWPRL
ncbi:hypothetical protein ACFLZM_05130, partial [Thermodesulfobacteriota bacterium]